MSEPSGLRSARVGVFCKPAQIGSAAFVRTVDTYSIPCVSQSDPERSDLHSIVMICVQVESRPTSGLNLAQFRHSVAYPSAVVMVRGLAG